MFPWQMSNRQILEINEKRGEKNQMGITDGQQRFR